MENILFKKWTPLIDFSKNSLVNEYFIQFKNLIPFYIQFPNLNLSKFPDYVNEYKKKFKRVFLSVNDSKAILCRGIFPTIYGWFTQLNKECFCELDLQNPWEEKCINDKEFNQSYELREIQHSKYDDKNDKLYASNINNRNKQLFENDEESNIQNRKITLEDYDNRAFNFNSDRISSQSSINNLLPDKINIKEIELINEKVQENENDFNKRIST